MSIATALAVLVVSLPAALAIHEAGHALAALALGRLIRVRLRLRPLSALGAFVEAELEGRARTVAFVLAGPATSVVVGAALVAAGGPWSIVGAVNALFGAVCACGSDGRQALRALTSMTRGNDGVRALR